MRVLKGLLAALAIILIRASVGSPVRQSSQSKSLVQFHKVGGLAELHFTSDPDKPRAKPSERSEVLNSHPHSRDLSLRSPNLFNGDLIDRSDSRRHLLNFSSIAYRLIDVYFIEPMQSGTKDMKNDIVYDLEAALTSVLRAVEKIRRDQPPLNRMSLTYGDLEFELYSPNPLDFDVIQEVIILSISAMKKFGAILFRLGAFAIGLVVTFGVRPRLSGSQNTITG